MPSIPEQPKIYHITHLKNLPSIISAGVLWSDKKRLETEFECELVGMADIKRARLIARPVKCFPDTMVGEYVPFYFCPRSIMLYILHKGNHPGIDYTEGQAPIVHLQADLMNVIGWANENNIRWAFSNRNAGARYTDFYSNIECLDQIDWQAVKNDNFRSPEVKEGKQAEFLLYDSFPLELVECVGVIDAGIQSRVQKMLRPENHVLSVEVEEDWYF